MGTWKISDPRRFLHAPGTLTYMVASSLESWPSGYEVGAQPTRLSRYKHIIFLFVVIIVIMVTFSSSHLSSMSVGFLKTLPCTVGQKKRNTSISSNANYRREMKLIPINVDYFLL